MESLLHHYPSHQKAAYHQSSYFQFGSTLLSSRSSTVPGLWWCIHDELCSSGQDTVSDILDPTQDLARPHALHHLHQEVGRRPSHRHVLVAATKDHNQCTLFSLPLFLLKQQCAEEPATIHLSKDAELGNYNKKFTASFPFYYALQIKYASNSVHNNNAVLVKHEPFT